MLALSVIAISGSGFQGGDAHDLASRESGGVGTHETRRVCVDAQRGLTWYRTAALRWRQKMGAGTKALLPRVSSDTPRACPRIIRLAEVARWLAHVARYRYERWHDRLLARLENPTQAILYVFGAYGQQALRVSSCESGRGIYARNGQFLGMFQMGDFARSRYGHSWTALGQARAAFRYFVESGRDWSPWSCKP